MGTAGVSWIAAAHPRFASDAPGASKSLLGVKGDWKEAIEKSVARGYLVRLLHDPDATIPASFDSATNWPQCAKIISDIRDQSNCGCCWAFAGAEAASDRMCIATNGSLLVPLSSQDVCFNSNDDGCNGGQIDTPWTFLQHHGAVSGGQYNGTGPFGTGKRIVMYVTDVFFTNYFDRLLLRFFVATLPSPWSHRRRPIPSRREARLSQREVS